MALGQPPRDLQELERIYSPIMRRVTEGISDVVDVLSLARLIRFLRRIGLVPPAPTPASTSTPRPGPTIAPVLRQETWKRHIDRMTPPER